MYDRSRRDFSFQGHAGTDIHVGPGAYDTDRPTRAKIRSDGYAPFSSLSTRDNFLTPNDTTVAAPGPGQYNVSGLGQAAAIGGSSLANRSARFPERKDAAPGPADYTVPVPSDALGRVGAAKAEAKAAGRVRFKRVDDAPSIPFPGQAYGFEENEHGLLVKQPAPDRDTSLGPAFYRGAGGGGGADGGGYKGCHWSKSRTRRGDLAGAAATAAPGPGDYDIGLAGQRTQVVHMNVREGKPPAELHVPRYNELVERQAVRNPVPGPGAYVVRGHFEQVGAAAVAAAASGDSAERPPFGVQSRRFGSAKEATPGPGAYSDPRTALTALKRGAAGAHLKKSPFGNTAIRFQEDSGTRLMPGPGAYAVSTGMLASESMKKVFLSAAQKGAFGSTAVRMQPFARRAEAERPGPASYEVQDKPRFQSKYTQPRSSMFASLTNRDFDPTLVEKAEMPHAAMYDVDRAYHKLHDRQQGYGPRNEAAKKRQSFLTSSDRFAGKAAAVGDPNVPGPANYSIKDSLDKRGAAPLKESRFREAKSDAPAPNHYHLSQTVESSVLRSTHNATLGNPMKLLAKEAAPQTATNSYVIRA